MWGKQKPHTDMYEVLTDSTNNFCASRRYVLISICFRFTIALRMEPCFFIFKMKWLITKNPANADVNSRVLYHWAIEDYSVFLHFFFGVRPCRCSTIELSRTILWFIHTIVSYSKISIPSKIHTAKSVPLTSGLLWSSPRPISGSQLHTLLHFRPCPIHLVVFEGSYSFRLGIPILRGASRLDAFSVYPLRAWLPCHGIGMPTGTPAARPSRSSRTRDSSSQNSCARAG